MVVTPAVADARVDEAVRLIFLDHGVKLVGFFRGNGVRAVEPDEAEVAVFREDFLYLRLYLALEAL